MTQGETLFLPRVLSGSIKTRMFSQLSTQTCGNIAIPLQMIRALVLKRLALDLFDLPITKSNHKCPL